MKIIRVLNTNAVVSVDSKQREVIITGPGIGFKKKKGEDLERSKIDKIYCLRDRESSYRLQEVVRAISEQYLEIAAKVVDTARTEENLKVKDTLYVTLTDHIHSAVERYQSGLRLKNILKTDIRKFYKKEYEIGKKAIRWIYEESGIDLGEEEAAFIAMHIVASELENSQVSEVRKITELITSIVQIVRMHFKIDFDEDSVSYQRFLTHLKFFSARIFDQVVYKDSMQEIYQVMVEQNARAYTGVEKVAKFIEKEYGHHLSIDEQLYLLIHIKRILDEQNKEEN